MKGHTYKRCPCPVIRDATGHKVNCSKKHGSWYFVHELPADTAGGRRQEARGGFPTQREAREALNSSLVEYQRGDRLAPIRLKVGEYLEQWLDSKGRLRSSTRRSYAEHIRLYLAPGLGFLKLTELREHDIEALYAAMRELGTSTGKKPSDTLRRLQDVGVRTTAARELSPARIRRVHATLLSAMNSAVKRKYISSNPAKNVEIASGHRPSAVVWTPDRITAWKNGGAKPAVAVWTADQAGRFLDTASRDRLYPLLHLIAYRGLR